MVVDGSNPSARGTRRSKDDVVDAALELLDRVGLPDLSMRRLAEHLGVQPSALYWHVENKQELLAAVSGRILATVTSPPRPAAASDAGPVLDVAARDLAMRLRDSLLSHRDGAEVVSSSLALGLVDPPVHAPLAAIGAESAAPPGLSDTIADAVTHFVVGFTFHQQQRRSADQWGAAAPPAQLSPQRVADADDDGFSAALDLIIAGASTALADRGPQRFDRADR
ncbi:TetR family transcriptional regulator [Microbacterium sp. cf332]|uniref:TetR family transcriptional regulator n=1 Tax=Microbacterium sp. cf332 TaxID=1761804 RepID=UPI000886902F|nr:TetR family transcriptional regulator [Microbacterium sp. cf332]SDQ75290.1 transcriptional regulator, TetR family [Microbacterium sp. cf332]